MGNYNIVLIRSHRIGRQIPDKFLIGKKPVENPNNVVLQIHEI